MPEKPMILPDMIGRKGLEVSLACPLSFIVFIWGQYVRKERMTSSSKPEKRRAIIMIKWMKNWSNSTRNHSINNQNYFNITPQQENLTLFTWYITVQTTCTIETKGSNNLSLNQPSPFSILFDKKNHGYLTKSIFINIVEQNKTNKKTRSIKSSHYIENEAKKTNKR